MNSNAIQIIRFLLQRNKIFLNKINQYLKNLNINRDFIYELKNEINDIKESTIFQSYNKSFKFFMEVLESGKDLDKIWKSFENGIYKFNLNIIKPSKGDKFNPKIHETLNESESFTIKKCERRGISYDSRCIRPALVFLED